MVTETLLNNYMGLYKFVDLNETFFPSKDLNGSKLWRKRSKSQKSGGTVTVYIDGIARLLRIFRDVAIGMPNVIYPSFYGGGYQKGKPVLPIFELVVMMIIDFFI